MNALWGLLLLACTLVPRPPSTEAITCLCEGATCLTEMPTGTGTSPNSEKCPDELPEQYKESKQKILTGFLDSMKEKYREFVTALNLTSVTVAPGAGVAGNESQVSILEKLTPGALTEMWNHLASMQQGKDWDGGKPGMPPQGPTDTQFCVKMKIGAKIFRGCGALFAPTGLGSGREERCTVFGKDGAETGFCVCRADFCNQGDVAADNSSPQSSHVNSLALYVFICLLALKVVLV